MRVDSVWPGGLVELPEFRVESEAVVVLQVGESQRCSLQRVILGLARAWDQARAGKLTGKS